MIGQRILIVLLVVNLFATLLVYRGLELLVERADHLACDSEVAAAGRSETRSVTPAPSVANTPLAPAKPTLPPVMTATQTPAADAAYSAAQEHVEVAPEDLDDIELIKTRYAAQYGDAARTAQVHQTLQQLANGSAEYVGITQDLLDCKETVCKLVLGYADQAVFEAFVDDLTMALKGDLSATLYFDDTSTVGGNSTVDVYLVRE